LSQVTFCSMLGSWERFFEKQKTSKNSSQHILEVQNSAKKTYLFFSGKICSSGFVLRRKLVRASTWSAGWSRSTGSWKFSQWFGARWFWVSWWFGNLGSCYERDCYLGVALESQTTYLTHSLRSGRRMNVGKKQIS